MWETERDKVRRRDMYIQERMDTARAGHVLQTLRCKPKNWEKVAWQVSNRQLFKVWRISVSGSLWFLVLGWQEWNLVRSSALVGLVSRSFWGSFHLKTVVKWGYPCLIRLNLSDHYSSMHSIFDVNHHRCTVYLWTFWDQLLLFLRIRVICGRCSLWLVCISNEQRPYFRQPCAFEALVDHKMGRIHPTGLEFDTCGL